MESMASREDIGRLETLIERKENQLLKWLIATVIAAGGLLAAAGFMLARTLT